MVIDHLVCEGCGDCGVQSNCLSLQPLDTEFGRKTVVDQASSNLDTSCLKGDCPAFLTVTPADRATRPAAAPPDQLPDPDLVVPAEGVTIRMPGVGGGSARWLSAEFRRKHEVWVDLLLSAKDRSDQEVVPDRTNVVDTNDASSRVDALR